MGILVEEEATDLGARMPDKSLIVRDERMRAKDDVFNQRRWLL